MTTITYIVKTMSLLSFSSFRKTIVRSEEIRKLRSVMIHSDWARKQEDGYDISPDTHYSLTKDNAKKILSIHAHLRYA